VAVRTSPSPSIAIADDELGRRLDPDERLLWSGRPAQGLLLRPSDLFIIPFSLLWCGFAIFWETSVARMNAPGFFLLWGGMFVAIGLYFVVGRFFVDAFQRARTTYAVTDRRVLILSGLWARSARTLALEGLGEIDLRERRDGSATLTFGRDPVGGWTWGGNGWPGSRRTAAPAFEGIADGAAVLRLIQDARRKALKD